MDNDVLYEYEAILMGRQKIFLLSFSDKTTDKVAAFRIVWRYAITRILGWTPEDALVNLDRDVMEKLKLDRTLKCIGLNIKGRLDIRSILAIVFPERIKDSLEERTREEYERVLKVGRWQLKNDPELNKFHKGFFTDDRAPEKAAVCLNYAVSLYLPELGTDERYRFFADSQKALDFISSVKLAPALHAMYREPLDFYHYSLPNQEKDYLLYYDLKVRNAANKIPDVPENT